MSLVRRVGGSLAYQKTTDFDLTGGFQNTQRKLIDSRGSSITNAHTAKERDNEIKHRVTAMGPQRGGAIYLDENGAPLKEITFYSSELGKMVTTDKDGKILFGNKQIVDEALAFYKEREELIDQQVEKVKINNDMCAYMLGYKTVVDLDNVLGAGKSFDVNGKALSADLASANGMPEAIRLLTPKSPAQLTAIYKLRLLVGERLDYINLMDFGRKKSDKDDINIVVA